MVDTAGVLGVTITCSGGGGPRLVDDKKTQNVTLATNSEIFTYFTYLIGVLLHTLEYFNCMTIGSITCTVGVKTR